MRAEGAVTDRPVRLEEAGPNEAIVASASSFIESSSPITPEPVRELEHLIERYFADSPGLGLARGTVAYRRVYLGQLVAWLQTRDITTARQVIPAVLADYLSDLKARVTTYKRERPSLLSVKTLAAGGLGAEGLLRLVRGSTCADVRPGRGPAPRPHDTAVAEGRAHRGRG
jgi:hypothetical protein